MVWQLLFLDAHGIPAGFRTTVQPVPREARVLDFHRRVRGRVDHQRFRTDIRRVHHRATRLWSGGRRSLVRHVDPDRPCGVAVEKALVRVGGDEHVRSSFGCWSATGWSIHGLDEIDLAVLFLGEPT